MLSCVMSCKEHKGNVPVCKQQNHESQHTQKKKSGSPSHLEDAVTVLRQSCRRVGGVHLCELFCEVADIQLIPNHWLERGRHLLSGQILPVNFLELKKKEKKESETLWFIPILINVTYTNTPSFPKCCSFKAAPLCIVTALAFLNIVNRSKQAVRPTW